MEKDTSSFDTTEENVSSSDASSSDAFFVALDVLLQHKDALKEDASSFITLRRCD